MVQTGLEYNARVAVRSRIAEYPGGSFAVSFATIEKAPVAIRDRDLSPAAGSSTRATHASRSATDPRPSKVFYYLVVFETVFGRSSPCTDCPSSFLYVIETADDSIHGPITYKDGSFLWGAISSDGTRFYVSPGVYVLDSSGVLLTTVWSGGSGAGHFAVADTPAGTRVYAPNSKCLAPSSDTVGVIDAATNTLLDVLYVAAARMRSRFRPMARAYVASFSGQYITFIDTATNTLRGTIYSGGFPVYITIGAIDLL